MTIGPRRIVDFDLSGESRQNRDAVIFFPCLVRALSRFTDEFVSRRAHERKEKERKIEIIFDDVKQNQIYVISLRFSRGFSRAAR